MAEGGSEIPKFRSSSLNIDDMFEEVDPDQNEQEEDQLKESLQAFRAMGGGGLSCESMDNVPSWGVELDKPNDDFSFGGPPGLSKSSAINSSSEKSTSWDAFPSSGAESSSSSSKSTSWDVNAFDSGFGDLAFGSFSITSSSDISSSVELEAMPRHIEKYSSFYSSRDAQHVFDEFRRVFDVVDNLDYEFHKHENKFSGVVRGNTSSACDKFWFSLRVYKAVDPNEVFVEMQKNGGCCVGFNTFYSQTLAQVSDLVVRRGTVPSGVDAGLANYLENIKGVHCPKEDEISESAERPKMSEGFIEMLRCEEMSDMRNVIGAMSQNDVASIVEVLVASEENVQVLMRSLQSSLTSDDDILVDDACSLLGSICEAQELRDDIVSNLLSPMFSKLSTPGSADSWHSKRHLIKALSVLCSSHSADIRRLPESEAYINTLKKLHMDIEARPEHSNKYSNMQENLSSTLQQIGAV